jgi:hypothetical protein
MMNEYYGPVRCDHLHFYGDPVDVMRALHVSFAQAQLKIWEWARHDFQIEQLSREIDQVELRLKLLSLEIDELSFNPYTLGIGPALDDSDDSSDYSGMFDNPFRF